MDDKTLAITVALALIVFVIAAHCLFALLIVRVKAKLFKDNLHISEGIKSEK